MTHPVLGVDHTYLLVHDLDATADLYRRLGFTLSPRGLHSPQKGTANYTIMFQDDYLELLGVVTETEQNTSQRNTLAQYGEGLQAIANRTQSAEAAKPALNAIGIRTGEASAFSRPLPLPGGGEGIASFRTLSFEAEQVPLGHFFLCQHETRDMVWRPELQQHANGAIGLGGIIGISDDPYATAETYAGFYAQGHVSEVEGGFRVATGDNSAPLLFFDHSALRDFYTGLDVDRTPRNGFAALQIRVSDLEQTRRFLKEQNIPLTQTSRGKLVIGPNHTSGVILEFH
ncbi:Glyoxalase-like domain-containing protein [Rhizobium sp. AN5]|uniref:VOC family protein n=1 Tax=Rhizobium sp. AN5 TaxID=1855304 RepID=UPI000BCC1C39|nr:VOC family protein [Rhizobium sp. AN5]SOC90357.1 Glyoxalase-like domain-containing protein [Rhizobium sp. AN5]